LINVRVPGDQGNITTYADCVKINANDTFLITFNSTDGLIISSGGITLDKTQKEKMHRSTVSS